MTSALAVRLGELRARHTHHADHLNGGLGRDILGAGGGNDEPIADDGDVDHVLCGDGLGDVARTDTAELTVSSCETRITPLQRATLATGVDQRRSAGTRPRRGAGGAAVGRGSLGVAVLMAAVCV